MKYRNGYVSNSSTTSFVLITTQKAYKTVLKRSDYVTQELIRVLEPEQIKVGGRNLVLISGQQLEMHEPFCCYDIYNERVEKVGSELLGKLFDDFVDNLIRIKGSTYFEWGE